MDVVDGNCVLCTDNTEVINTTFCNQFRALLKIHYFEVNKEDFKQFSKLFDSRNKVPHSFCVPCTFKLNCYFGTRNACNQANKTGTSSKTCSLCNNNDYVTKCTKQLNDDFKLVFKGIKKTTHHLTYTCLRCLLSINAFKEIKESITQLLNAENDNPEQDATMKKSKSPKVETPLALRKRKNHDDNKVDTPKRLKQDRSIEETKKSGKRHSKVLEKKLKHLNNVNAETIDRDMNLSYQVVTDQKLMFDIPFVNCNSAIESDSAKLNGINTRQKAKKVKLSANNEDDVIDVSSDEESENTRSSRSKRISSSTPNTSFEKRSTRLRKISNSGTSGNDSETTTPVTRPRRGILKKSVASPPKYQKKRTPEKNTKNISPAKSQRGSNRTAVKTPVFKTPKIKFKGSVKIQQEVKPKYPCKNCTAILKMKYISILHELEHDASYSPMITVEKQDLLVLKESLKLLDKQDENEGVTSELEQDASTEEPDIEKKADDMITDDNEDEDSESLHLRLDEEKEDEVKKDEDGMDAAEETDKDDVSAEKDVPNEIDESNEKPDEENDKMDVSIEKDVIETDKDVIETDKDVIETDKDVIEADKETVESDDKLDENVEATSDKEEGTSDEVVESPKDQSPKKQNESKDNLDQIVDDDSKDTDAPEADKENTDVTEISSNEEDTVVESSKDETKGPIEETEKNDEAEKSDEDCSKVVATSPERKQKTPSPIKSDKGESPKKLDAELEKDTTMEVDDSDIDESATNEVAKSPEKNGNEQNGSNDEETPEQVQKSTSPKKTDKTASPKKQKDLKENGDEQEKDTLMEVDADAKEANKDIESPKKSSESPSPKRAKSASPKKPTEAPENKVDDSEEQSPEAVTETANDETKISEETDKKETSTDIPKEEDKNLSPISSDNESNTEPNDNVSKGSDFSDNENERSENKEQKSNGFVDNEFEFTLKLSSSEESNSPGKKNISSQENNITSEENTNSVSQSSDQDTTFQIVENILQNLGA